LTHHTNKRAQWGVVFVTAGLSSLVLATPASAFLADSVWGGGYGYVTAEDRAVFAVSRLIFIGISTLIGFACGWILSPEGRHVRNAALLIMVVLIGSFTLLGVGPMAQGLAMTFAFLRVLLGHWILAWPWRQSLDATAYNFWIVPLGYC